MSFNRLRSTNIIDYVNNYRYNVVMFRSLTEEPLRNLVLCDENLNIWGQKYASEEALRADYKRLSKNDLHLYIARKSLTYSKQNAYEMTVNSRMVQDDIRQEFLNDHFSKLLFLLAQSDIYCEEFQRFLGSEETIVSFDRSCRHMGYFRKNNDGNNVLVLNDTAHKGVFDLASTFAHEITHGLQPILQYYTRRPEHITHKLFRSRFAEAEARAVEMVYALEMASGEGETLYGIPRYNTPTLALINKKRLKGVYKAVIDVDKNPKHREIQDVNQRYKATFASAFLAALNCDEFMKHPVYDQNLIKDAPLNTQYPMFDANLKMSSFTSFGFDIGKVIIQAGIDFSLGKSNFMRLDDAAYKVLKGRIINDQHVMQDPNVATIMLNSLGVYKDHNIDDLLLKIVDTVAKGNSDKVDAEIGVKIDITRNKRREGGGRFSQ